MKVKSVVLVLSLVLVGCTLGGSVESWDIEHSQEYCRDLGGLRALELNTVLTSDYRIRCNDGTLSGRFRLGRRPET